MNSTFLFVLVSILLHVQPLFGQWIFEDAAPGKMPSGWTAARTGERAGSQWQIVSENFGTGTNQMLAQVSADGRNPVFNLCVLDEQSLADVNISVEYRAVAGKIDQGGGPVWRYQDENNYYICRHNPLENNFRIYKVIDGKRTQLASLDVAAQAGQWHMITASMTGDQIVCSVNGEKLEVSDSTIPRAGKVGLWTKADAQTQFDNFHVKAAGAPSQVFVVNTGDDSISLIDLNSMKELRKVAVGKSPYGVAVSPDGKRVAVGVEGEGKVKFFDTQSFEQLAEVAIGEMHHDHIVLTPDGKFMLDANFHSDTIVGIDVQTMKEAYRIEGCSAPHVVKYGPLNKLAYVTCKKVTGIAIVDPAERKLVKFHQLNVNPRSLTFSPDESKLYFGSFWVDGFFEMDTESGKVTRLFNMPTPKDNSAPQEVTYHGCEAIGNSIVLAANEGRSWVDAVNVETGEHLDRLTEVNKPCCVERIPGTNPVRVLISNIGDGTIGVAEVSTAGKIKLLGNIAVGAAPKRVAFWK